MHLPVCIKWARGLTVTTEFHDQGLCVKARTAGGLHIQMVEVKRPGPLQIYTGVLNLLVLKQTLMSLEKRTHITPL